MWVRDDMYKKHFKKWKWRKNNRQQQIMLDVDPVNTRQEIQTIPPTDTSQRKRMVLVCASNYIDSLGLENETKTHQSHFTSPLLGSGSESSWQAVNQQTGSLIALAKSGNKMGIRNAFNTLLCRVEYALKVDMDANLMVKFWRICCDLVEASKLAKDLELRPLYAFLGHSAAAVDGMMKRGEVIDLNVRQCHLLWLLHTLSRTPRDEIAYLLSQAHFESISKLQKHIGPEHFAILQMSTHYLTAWDLTSLKPLHASFENLIESASYVYGSHSMEVIMSMHQHLFYAWEILKDQQKGEEVAQRLQSRARDNLQNDFNGVTRAFVHATRALIELCAVDGRLAQATHYLNLAIFHLEMGDDECHKRITMLRARMQELLANLSTTQ